MILSNSLLCSLLSLSNISCPAGWVITDDGRCTDDNECDSAPCYNGGSCINLDEGKGFMCVCTDGFSGDMCHLPASEKVILIAKSTYWLIAFFLVNALGKKSFTTKTL